MSDHTLMNLTRRDQGETNIVEPAGLGALRFCEGRGLARISQEVTERYATAEGWVPSRADDHGKAVT